MEQLPELPHVEPEVVPEMTPVASREVVPPVASHGVASTHEVDTTAALSAINAVTPEVSPQAATDSSAASQEVAVDVDTSNPATLETELFATE